MAYPSTILLVDDSRMDIELALDAFGLVPYDHVVQVARGGQMALDYLFGVGPYADRTRHPLPDLILLDLKMPGIDGFEVLRRIKGTPLLKRLPVVVLTSSSVEEDLTRSLDGGANSYLIKPIDFEGFLDLVRKIGDYWLTLNTRPPMAEVKSEP